MTSGPLAYPSDSSHGWFAPECTAEFARGCLPSEFHACGTMGPFRVRRTFRDEGGCSQGEIDKQYAEADMCDGTFGSLSVDSAVTLQFSPTMFGIHGDQH